MMWTVLGRFEKGGFQKKTKKKVWILMMPPVPSSNKLHNIFFVVICTHFSWKRALLACSQGRAEETWQAELVVRSHVLRRHKHRGHREGSNGVLDICQRSAMSVSLSRLPYMACEERDPQTIFVPSSRLAQMFVVGYDGLQMDLQCNKIPFAWIIESICFIFVIYLFIFC